MKFRKKLVIVDVWQITQKMIDDVFNSHKEFEAFYETLEGVRLWFNHKIVISGEEKSRHPQVSIKNLEGDMKVNAGDWIITGVMGEHYACKPDIFEKTYEKVEETNEKNV